MKSIVSKLIALIFISIITFANTANATSFTDIYKNSTNIQPLFSELKYEAKEKTSLENPVVDPNFNVMRNTDMNKPLAVILVGGILIVAIIAPIVTWKYFSR